MSAGAESNPTERRQSFRANVVALITLGVSDQEIAKRLGVSVFAVRSALRRTRGAKKSIQRPRSREAPAETVCEVPHWVPDSFVGTYQDLAAEHGEEHAASVVRRLKAGARP